MVLPLSRLQRVEPVTEEERIGSLESATVTVVNVPEVGSIHGRYDKSMHADSESFVPAACGECSVAHVH